MERSNEWMKEATDKETCLIETIDLQEGAFLAENQRQLSYIGSRKIFYDYRFCILRRIQILYIKSNKEFIGP